MSRIEIKDVTKNFKSVRAVNHVNITLEEGKIYGLLGRNGAGKSTLLNLINSRLAVDEGSITMDGESLWENPKVNGKLYLVNEKNLFPEGRKVSEIFRWTKEFFPEFDMEYAMHLAQLFQLDTRKKTKGLSTGYQSIFKNIVALSTHAPFVFLDEPVLGLDAYHRDLFYRLLLERYAGEPFTLVISTHLIEEVAGIVEEVIILKKGEVLKIADTEELLNMGYTVSGPASLVDAYTRDKDLAGADTLGGLKTAYVLGRPERELPEGLEFTKMDLQKLFIRLTDEA